MHSKARRSSLRPDNTEHDRTQLDDEGLHGHLHSGPIWFFTSTKCAEIWIDASSIVAGIKMLLGIDPKEDHKVKVAQLTL